MTNVIIDGQRFEMQPDGRIIRWYPKPERLVVDAAQYAVPDARDARIAELERAMRHIRTLAHDAEALVSVGMDNVVSAIYLLAVDALAGEAQPTSTVDEAMAI